MQVVSQVVRTIHTTVSIKNSKIGRLLPVCPNVFRLSEIKDDGNAVFIVLSHWALISGCGVCADGSMAIFGVLGWFEVGDGDKYFGEGWVIIFVGPDAASLDVECLRLDEDLLANDLVDLLSRRLRLRARLILVTVLDCRSLGEFKTLVGVVELPLLNALLAVEVRCALLWIFGCRWLCYLDLRRRVRFKSDPCPHARKHWRNFRRVLR